MKRWLIRSGPVGMALIWGFGGFFAGGGFMEAIVDPHGKIADIWPMVIGLPGLVAGALFWVVLRIAEGRRGADEVPLGRLVAWGAVSAALVGAILFVWIVPSEVLPGPLMRALAIIGIPALAGAIAAVVTAFLFRWARRETRQRERASTHP